MAVTIGNGTLALGGAILTTSAGDKVAVYLDAGVITIDKDVDGTPTNVTTDTATNVHGGGNIAWISATIDVNDDVHVASSADSLQTRDVAYRICDLTTGWVGSWVEARNYTDDVPPNPGCSIDIDIDDWVTIACIDGIKYHGTTYGQPLEVVDDGGWTEVDVWGNANDHYSQISNCSRATGYQEVIYRNDDTNQIWYSYWAGAVWNTGNFTYTAGRAGFQGCTGNDTGGWYYATDSADGVREGNNDTGSDSDSTYNRVSPAQHPAEGILGAYRFIFFIDTSRDVHLLYNQGAGGVDVGALEVGTFNYVIADNQYANSNRVRWQSYIFDDGTDVFYGEYDLIQIDNIPAYMEGSPAGTDTSDDTLAFLAGGIEDLDDQWAFAWGSIDVSDNKYAWLAGGIEDSDNQWAFAWGSLDDLDDIFAWLAGGIEDLDDQWAYLAGIAGADDNQLAWLAGGIEDLDDQLAWLAGGIEDLDNQIAWLAGGIEVSDAISAFMWTLVPDNISAWLAGGIEDLDSQWAWAAGGIEDLDNIYAWLAGGIEVSDSLSAFMWTLVPDNQPAWLAGGIEVLDDQWAFVWGQDDVLDFSLAFLAGGIVITDDIFAFAAGVDGAEDAQSAYLVGWDTDLDNVSAFTWGQINTLDDIFAYAAGQDHITSNIKAFTKGALHPVEDIPAFLWGQDTDLDNIPAFMLTNVFVLDSQSAFVQVGESSSIPVFVVSGELEISNVPAYMAGIDTDLDSQSAFAAGGVVATDAIPGYLVGSSELSSSLSAFMSGGLDDLDSTPAFIVGGVTEISAALAFAAGGIEVSTSVENYLKGEDYGQTSAPCFLAGQFTAQSDNPAYLAASSDASDGQAAFTYGDVEVLDSVSAYMPVAGDISVSAVSAFIYGEVIPDYSLEASHILVYNLNGSFIRTRNLTGSFIDDYDLWGTTE